MNAMTDLWMQELEDILDPGEVWKYGVLVAARLEIVRLRKNLREITDAAVELKRAEQSWVSG